MQKIRVSTWDIRWDSKPLYCEQQDELWALRAKYYNITLYHCLCWHQLRGLQFMTLGLSKPCRKTFTSRFNYKLFCAVGNRESTVLISLTSHLLAAKPEARCEFPLLSQCQPGLSPHSPSLPLPPSAETQQQVSQEMLTDCKAQLAGCWH